MARFVALLSLVAAVGAISFGVMPAGAPAAGPRPAIGPTVKAKLPVGVDIKRCSRGGPAGRFATFVGTMPGIAGASRQRLQMRFELFERPDIGGSWKPVAGFVDWDNWESSEPGAGGLRYQSKAILNRGRAYRAVARFRWVDESGKVVREATRFSPACVQPDPRPDLTVEARAGAGGIFVMVSNAGRAAGAFEVRVTSAGRQLAGEKVASLAAGRARPIVFNSASCPAGSTVKVAVDSGSAITERSEANNAVELRCPASG